MVDEDPRFVDADGVDDDPATYVDNDYRLCVFSPGVETGDPNPSLEADEFDVNGDGNTSEPTPDLDLNMRVLDSPGGVGAIVDMGAFEFVPLFCPYDCGGGHVNEVEVIDLLALLGQWGLECTSCDFQSPGVGVDDVLGLLGAWGPCPLGGTGVPENVQECLAKFGLEPSIVLSECICAVDPETCE